MSVTSTVKSCSPSSSSSSVILKSMQLVVGPPTKNVVLTKPRGLKSPTAKGKLNQEILITELNNLHYNYIYIAYLLCLQ